MLPVCSVGPITIIGVSEEMAQVVILLSAAMLLLAWMAGFLVGACRCEQTGIPHLDATISYLRLHVFNRKAATEVTQWFNALGVPLTLTDPREYAALASVASLVLMKSAHALRSRRSICA